MAVAAVDIVGLTVPPPQEPVPVQEEAPPPPLPEEPAPLPPEQGIYVDELA